jgi:NADPH:quinone reductase-like Zn-dependent oxidoreductase
LFDNTRTKSIRKITVAISSAKVRHFSNKGDGMRSWQLKNTGIQNLGLVDLPTPELASGEVLVRVRSVSLNYRDKAIVDETYPLPTKFPIVPASDLAGDVVAVGANVTHLKPGDKVISVFKPYWLDGTPSVEAYSSNLASPLPGVLAEYVVLPESGALPYPAYLTPAQASTLPIAAVTAWVALVPHGNLRPGQTVLVQGSGGVSLIALQIAVAYGARVLATSRSEGKIKRMQELGADYVVNTTQKPAWDQEVRKLTGGRGVDQVIDVLGGEALQRSISASAWGGHVAVIGFMEQQAATIQTPSLIGTAATVQGVGVGSRKDTQDVLSFLEKHGIQPVIDAEYDFTGAPEAFAHLDRGPFGKVVINIA